MTDRFEFAKQFGRIAHDSIGQKRKYSGEPYWTHTEAVCDLVSKFTNDEDILIAAAHHDIIEDVYPIKEFYSPDLITNIFGYRVSRMILGLTDKFTKENFPNLNRAQRKEKERKRLGREDFDVKLVKICDLIHNTADIVFYDKGFAITYLKEKAALLPYLKENTDPRNVSAWAIANEQVEKFVKELDVRI